ncbi:thioredoxin TrxC [Fluoribacter gormanii]|uniref:Thioredoxin n=1 Tax=Fluoribacter gormanii TaxID=464 RepID=A0A377GGN6_9GAMM|nr:thioredoxin TrxC [Fluoribacter gormanii]KTD05452.1 thioredoxin [Fluoribacter gormanii]MCW8444544.1 thioredoxin TrxC [Fluoribacter gormanii]MCW8469736.1 thioredoxin TrxC [Fluoribacter gormanii]SIR76079.1 thioredoxin [Fluoribacter gormanii]STO23931.1 Thioredoxin-2 [Fluoribacter gormanii]
MSDPMHIVCPHCHIINRLPETRLNEHPNCGKCKKELFDGKPIQLTQTLFERHINRNDIPVLVDFWAQWCGPCKMMAPYFESAAGLLEPNLRLVKVNTETEQALASHYAIQSIPTLMLFLHGKEVARHSGVMGVQDIVRWVNQQLG